MRHTLNLALLPAARQVDFLVWIIENQIGNHQDLLGFIANDERWHLQETIPFECSKQEALWILLRWS
jgi:hypothetical protein